MSEVLNVPAVVFVGIAAIWFGNWLATRVFGVVHGIGAIAGTLVGRSDRMAPFGLLSLAGQWAWVLNNVFIIALIVAVAGTFLQWGVAAGASAVSWCALTSAAVLYFAGGVGEGINQTAKHRVLTA